MNIFRLAGDLTHLGSILILLHKMHMTKSCAGISFKTQCLYLLVFMTRYLDLFIHYISLYNTLMKIFFIASSGYIVYLMRKPFKHTYEASLDTFRAEYLVLVSAVLSVLLPHKYTPIEVLWTFSIFLEAVAILPQLFQMTRTGEAETITAHYVFTLGAYRALYLLNWIYRYYTTGHVDWVACIAGLVQTALYGDFFYIYFVRIFKNKAKKLPV
ncbi:endoplasmic reticulum retention protein [Spiromyces aspiralis]|uniref:Endoplasmic reticulum retention protein n=1 Tax=Spiromyces aspiralis TaxID=68401 RepID=A0ACC1HHZ2_9FUNG|nr:endoplasmic reticulum retention protein [Spiromyces aspiralis]